MEGVIEGTPSPSCARLPASCRGRAREAMRGNGRGTDPLLRKPPRIADKGVVPSGTTVRTTHLAGLGPVWAGSARNGDEHKPHLHRANGTRQDLSLHGVVPYESEDRRFESCRARHRKPRRSGVFLFLWERPVRRSSGYYRLSAICGLLRGRKACPEQPCLTGEAAWENVQVSRRELASYRLRRRIPQSADGPRVASRQARLRLLARGIRP